MKLLIKNGQEYEFHKPYYYSKIDEINKALIVQVPDKTIRMVIDKLYDRCRKRRIPTPEEELEDMLEIELMKAGAYEVARRYIRKRCYDRSLIAYKQITNEEKL